MNSVVLGVGLTREVLSPEPAFRSSRTNVGRQEIERLLGEGASEGPLPRFLRAATAAGVHLVLLGDLGEPGPGSELADPIAGVAEGAIRLVAPPLILPWREVVDAVRRATGLDPSDAASRRAGLRFLVVGCHTERRVHALASFLRSAMGQPAVAVSAHLVGSATREAHFATLRYHLPCAGVKVHLDLGRAAEFLGFDPAAVADLGCRPCAIEPEEVGRTLEASRRSIVESLCMHWDRARLRPLAGGFSGSQIFLAEGWKGGARTEPMVLKLDEYERMRRELEGYHSVKDFFGKHVPTFGFPVHGEDAIGVGMELAAMEGKPGTLQDSFEAAEDEDGFRRFLRRLDKALVLLSDKLYRNTRRTSWVVPYRAFGLHVPRQLVWLRENAGHIRSYLAEATTPSGQPIASHETTVRGFQPETIARLLETIAANEDGVDGDVCLSHGDLNLGNVICDDHDNIWFIDWTHSGLHPVEIDFAKLENDVKFVASKDFALEDLPRVRRFEEYLLAHRLPADPNGLPDELRFSKWDLRFSRMLRAVRRIREVCFGLKSTGDWIVYRVALLKHALYSLSFDARRGLGECETPQLAHALHSVKTLVLALATDEFNLRIRSERPPSYPPRQLISIDDAPWSTECPGYAPPYHVDPIVLANDRRQLPGGWADPEDPARTDPRNPRGRTGLAGRGLLGRWGPNPSVAAVVMRRVGEDAWEILLGREGECETRLGVPKGFVRPEETPEEAILRVLRADAGWTPEAPGEVVFEGYSYDARQTDDAWVESRVYLFALPEGVAPDSFESRGSFSELEWRVLEPDTIHLLASHHARFVRQSVTRLSERELMAEGGAARILAGTGR